MPPRASHFGGAWERLIKSVKRSLRLVLQDHVIHEDTLHTSLCEIESVLNSRPISYVGDDASNPSPLTPNHFLHHSSTVVAPPNVSDPADSNCRKRWRESQLITQHLWSRWRKEYLPSLTVSNKWKEECRSLQKNDVVLIVDKNAPRGCWPIARVVEAHIGRNGRVRHETLKQSPGTWFVPLRKFACWKKRWQNWTWRLKKNHNFFFR